MNKQQRNTLNDVCNNISEITEAINALLAELAPSDKPNDLVAPGVLVERLQSVIGSIDAARSTVEEEKDAENDKINNMPESLEGSDRYAALEATMSHLEDAQLDLESGVSDLEALVTKLEKSEPLEEDELVNICKESNMSKSILLAAVVAALAGCATQPEPAGGEYCTLPVTRNAGMGVMVTGCAAWTFGPSRAQKQAFDEKRMPNWRTVPR